MEQQTNETTPQYATDPETGDTIYEDPQSKTVYILDKETNTWKPKQKEKDPADQPYEFDGQTYFHTDANGVRHKWDLDKKTWIKIEEKVEAKLESSEESEEDDTTTDEDRKARMFRKRKAQPGWNATNYTKDPNTGVTLYKDPNDQMTYEWDEAKKAWVPSINEDFIAQYQMNYGFTKDGKAEPTLPAVAEDEDKTAAEKQAKVVEKKPPAKPQWFEQDQDKTTKVYVQGLPTGQVESDEWSEEQFAKFMSKCGVIDVDVRTNKPKVKLYKDSEGNFKGDGLCTYMRVESVQLALSVIDGGTLDHHKTPLKVEKAKFEMKGNYNPKLKPKKLNKKEQERAKKKQDKMLAWEPDKLRGERSKKDRILVIENVFDPSDFDDNAALILECSKKLREQCSKFGTVRKVVVYDKHPNGICQVFFATPEEADVAIPMLNGRLFANSNKPMKAFTWDGKTKYKIDETAEEEKERLSNWDKFLETDENDT